MATIQGNNLGYQCTSTYLLHLCRLSDNSESAVNTITDTKLLSRAPLLEINETSFDESPSSPPTEMTDVLESTTENRRNNHELPIVTFPEKPSDENDENPEV